MDNGCIEICMYMVPLHGDIVTRKKEDMGRGELTRLTLTMATSKSEGKISQRKTDTYWGLILKRSTHHQEKTHIGHYRVAF
jgi:hypothetical protein